MSCFRNTSKPLSHQTRGHKDKERGKKTEKRHLGRSVDEQENRTGEQARRIAESLSGPSRLKNPSLPSGL